MFDFERSSTKGKRKSIYNKNMHTTPFCSYALHLDWART